MLSKIVRSPSSNPTYSTIQVLEAINLSRGVGGDKDLGGTVQRYKRLNGNNTCSRQHCSGGDLFRKERGLGSDLVREARYTVTDRTLHTDRRGAGGEGSIYYNNTNLDTPYNSSSTPFLAIRLTLHSCTNRERSAIH